MMTGAGVIRYSEAADGGWHCKYFCPTGTTGKTRTLDDV